LLKAGGLVLLFGAGLLLSALLVHPLLWLGGVRAQGLRDRVVRTWFRGFLWICRVQVSITGTATQAPALFVANHMGWLDILVLGACLPVSFVAKAEVKRWPVVGWLCASADTLFVERGNLHSTAQISRSILRTLQRGRSVLLFPEGTSTDGSVVKPFRRRLFRPALEAACPTQAVTLLYPKAGYRCNPAVRYAGDDTLWHSVLSILSAPRIEAQLVFAPPLITQTLTVEDDMILARQAHAQVWESLQHAHNHAA